MKKIFAPFLNQTKRFVPQNFFRGWSRLQIFSLASDWTTWFFIPFWIPQNVDMRDHNQTYCALVWASVTLSWHLSQVAQFFLPVLWLIHYLTAFVCLIGRKDYVAIAFIKCQRKQLRQIR